MKISRLIEELRAVKKVHGDVEVTRTGSTLKDGFNAGSLAIIRATGREPKNRPADVFETTVETLIVHEKHPVHGKAVRLWL